LQQKTKLFTLLKKVTFSNIFIIFVTMKRITGILVLLVLVMTMLFLPNYPALHYFFNKTLTISNSDATLENTHSLIGDFKYLAAITERAADTKEAKATPPPKPHKEVTNLVYLLSELHMNIELSEITTSYNEFVVVMTGRFIPVGNPPPKA